MPRTMTPLLVLALASVPIAAQPPPFEFTRMVAHWDRYDDPGYLPFIAAARPQVAQLGFYGAHFWSLAHTSAYGGYPSHFPVRGLAECGTWLENRNRAVQRLGTKVIGHFNVEFLVGDPQSEQGPRGFFKFYRELWDETELGPRPVDDPTAFLERDAAGRPISGNNYNIGGMREYWACLRNPHWQVVLKAWVKRGIERGLDGFIANYFYRHNCLCPHCQRGFRSYLEDRFSAEDLQRQFHISDLRRHVFPELVAWHDPAQSTPLRREMLRWSQISNKRVFDEVFVRYGRALKSDLLTAQWNHLGNFAQIESDERCLLPAELWARGEDYLWYSTGAAAFYTDLANQFLGEGTLQARYLRGASDDKPFTLGKYENTRIRVAIAELAANGGAPMGFYTRFTDPAARREIVRYFRFLARHDALYQSNRPYAEAVLLFPRRAVQRGEVAPLDAFRKVGRRLLDRHLLFEVQPDDRPAGRRGDRPVVSVSPDASQLPAAGDPRFSRFVAPYTVRVSATRPATGNACTLHFVNYNRHEPPPGPQGKPSPGRGIVDERPIPATGVAVDLVIPTGQRVTRVTFLTPEADPAEELPFRQLNGRVSFELPEFLVYAVVDLRLQREGCCSATE